MTIKKWNGSAWVAEYPLVDVDSIVASGTPSSSTFLRGDGAWGTPSGTGAHSHGNIGSGGHISASATIASGDHLVIADNSSSNALITSTITFGTGTSTFLRNDGTWAAASGGGGNTWTEIKTGQTTVSGGTGATNISLSDSISDTSVIAFELNTASAQSYTSQIFIVKIEDTNSNYAGILFNSYANNAQIRTGSIRVFRTLSMGPTSTSVSFSYSYYHTNGSSSESSDTVYIGKIWKLGVTGA
jgi:hypothetical protein